MPNPCWCTDPERSDCWECTARQVDETARYEAILFNLRESLGLRKNLKVRGQRLRRMKAGYQYD